MAVSKLELEPKSFSESLGNNITLYRMGNVRFITLDRTTGSGAGAYIIPAADRPSSTVRSPINAYYGASVNYVKTGNVTIESDGQVYRTKWDAYNASSGSSPVTNSEYSSGIAIWAV